MSPSILESVPRFALPFAVGTGYWLVGALHHDPAVAAEASYLGLLVTAVLFCAAAVAPRIGTVFSALAVLVAAVPWALPGTADRGAAVGLLLASALLVAGSSVDRGGWSARSVLAVALGAQLLIRSPQLLSPGPLAVIATVAWATVAAAGAETLRRRCGSFAALLAAAGAFVLGSGFGPWSSLALVAAAAATVAADATATRTVRSLALASLLLPLLFDPKRGLLLLCCAAVATRRELLSWLAGIAGVLALALPGASFVAAPGGLLWGVLLLPTLVTRPLVKVELRLPALLLLLATAAHSDDLSLLALPLVTLAVTAESRGRISPVLQTGWSVILAAVATVLGAYPWLRESPLTEALELFGLAPDWTHALLVGLVAVAGRAADRFARSGPPAARAAAWSLAALVALSVSGSRAPTAWLGIVREPVTLDAVSPIWRATLKPPVGASSLSLDSTLSNAAALPRGTVVARLYLATSAGERVLPVRAGIESGEWAARRADVATLGGFAAPAPFLAWVARGGDFFGQRYRSRWTLPAGQIESLEVRLVPGLPADLVVTLFHLELRR